MNAIQWTAKQITPGFSEWKAIDGRPPTKGDELIEFVRQAGKADSELVAKHFGILRRVAFTRLAYAEKHGRIRRIASGRRGVAVWFEVPK